MNNKKELIKALNENISRKQELKKEFDELHDKSLQNYFEGEIFGLQLAIDYIEIFIGDEE